jgi:hypothetical protein
MMLSVPAITSSTAANVARPAPRITNLLGWLFVTEFPERA